MNIPNKHKRQEIAFNYSSDIDFRDFMNLCNKHTAKSYSFLVIDATLVSNQKLIMTIVDETGTQPENKIHHLEIRKG